MVIVYRSTGLIRASRAFDLNNMSMARKWTTSTEWHYEYVTRIYLCIVFVIGGSRVFLTPHHVLELITQPSDTVHRVVKV